MPTMIFLIRHGQTAGNAQKRYCGKLDLCLNAQGRLQVEKLGRRMKQTRIHKIYVSPQKRAIQSARIIFKGRKITRVADLREIDFGIFEGKSHQEIMQCQPGIYQKWLTDPYNTVVQGSESLLDFQGRVMRAFNEVVFANLEKTTAVVCHGGSISIILSSISGSNKFWEFIPGSASLSVIEYRKDKAEITIFNDISHLNG